MKKIDKFWLAVASLLYPRTDSTALVSLEQISLKHVELFERQPTPSLEQTIISSKRKYTNRAKPTQGGSPKRYLFRTDDGHTASPRGKFRLYKASDVASVGPGKVGAPCPDRKDVLEQFRYLVDWYWESYVIPSDEPGAEAERRDAVEALAEEVIQGSRLSATEKATLIKARRGQGVFREKVIEVESGCRLTGVTDKRFLVASHIKPWTVSSDEERLDGHNGLLLAPHADRLFDGGFITFTQDGSVALAPEAKEVWRTWGLGLLETTGMPLTPQQEIYMRYHREHRFCKWRRS
ncbi:HNH endonuclease [Corallococcus exiguus]|uniref:HNH endonuclease n=1 Tax=Corallococcus exiguus TaxID=83462 RepID=UPI001A8C0876|nr:HNH endonuclease signature motif containing protein [Corallococcus exiguus]MBN8467173.1 HNH endonuclease [Corallococcus exiguus]